MQQMKLYEQYKKDIKQVQLEHERELQRGHAHAAALQEEIAESRSNAARACDALSEADARVQALERDLADMRQQCKVSLARERSMRVRLLYDC